MLKQGIYEEINKPMSFVWRLHEEMPSYLLPRANNKNIL